MTRIEKEMQELAVTNWNAFVTLTGIDPTNFEICTKRKQGKSYNSIAISTKVHREKVRRVCRICP